MSKIFSTYSPISQNNDRNGSSDKLLEDSHVAETAPRMVASHSTWHRYSSWMFLGCILIVNTIVVLAYMLSRPECTPRDHSLSMLYSPANLSVEYELVQFNGTVGLKSPYSGTPSPEIDAAWDRITTHDALHVVRLPADYYERMNMPGRPSNVRFHEEDGGGYFGTMDMFHVLHCLNLIRKYTYLEYYPKVQETQRTRPSFFREHLDHCLETLRQHIMCASDIAVITYDWIEDFDKPFPNFNIVHQCRNFEKILEWTEENTLQIDHSHVVRIGDEVDLPESAVDLDGVLNIRKNATLV
ncbi:uncharacterized protein LAESUDRAFT_727628 [Laetiporus sulphureus 93-53]|uniref:Tat pathway signal sequence n=1 Tax=Laetiporus sulphureus 93-53 TaxID=1314785 RepID=A0A165DF56_9APHY|nr:uncharacterized protein LAESUDRAFT_727628 [Laetiporus sulphureus 93-53]KZT04757.1 hypothetical protein LAESUDRAFT_727628 [Laetiporus sulphureus 93-53]